MDEKRPKKILITGKGSYIGTSLEKWLQQWPDQYLVDKITVKDDFWKTYDFSKCDAVFHVAGIVHQKEKPEMENLYFAVNRDLALEVAKKAKLSGVHQFIFMSSMSVYGLEGKIGETVVITKDTPCHPNTFYGRSKYEAEQELQKLEDESFKVVIIRPPMVYGKGCKGNYARLVDFVLRTPFFPDIKNKRSMIYIENLTEFVNLVIENCSSGLFFPQNSEYVKTSEMVESIAEIHRKKIKLTKSFNLILRFLKTSTINKVFGDLVYEKEMSKFKNNYCVKDFKTSILITERQS
jgi:nucleoside-diphosphate-sugar epimerase